MATVIWAPSVETLDVSTQPKSLLSTNYETICSHLTYVVAAQDIFVHGMSGCYNKGRDRANISQ